MVVLMGVGVGRREDLYGEVCDSESLGGVAMKDGRRNLEAFLLETEPNLWYEARWWVRRV